MLRTDGRFVLGTYAPEDGAVVGDHWVTVIRMPVEGGRPNRGKSRAARGESAPAWDRVTYPQTVTVTAGGDNNFSIALTSELVAKYARADR